LIAEITFNFIGAVSDRVAGAVGTFDALRAALLEPVLAGSPESIRLAAGLPHKLALGEILVFPVRDGHVLAATNLHGRLVFERHPLPR